MRWATGIGLEFWLSHASVMLVRPDTWGSCRNSSGRYRNGSAIMCCWWIIFTTILDKRTYRPKWVMTEQLYDNG